MSKNDKTLPEYKSPNSGKIIKPGMVVGDGKIRIVVEKIIDRNGTVVMSGTQVVQGVIWRKEGPAEVSAAALRVAGVLSPDTYARLGLKAPASEVIKAVARGRRSWG